MTTPVRPIRPVATEFTDLRERRISAATARKYGVTNINDPENEVLHVYPYYHDGVHVANKIRTRSTKGFAWEGDVKATGLFGQNIFPAKSAKKITLVEGECDAMAAFEMMGSRYPVVSVKSANEASRNVAEQFEYLNSFEEIVVCFDKDEAKVKPDGTVHYPGQEAAIAVAAQFAIGKVRILTLGEGKDPNEYLYLPNGPNKFRDEWWAAPMYTPAGLKKGSDMWEEVSTEVDHETVLYPWDSLNQMTYGLRLSEVVLINAPTGIGKTTLLKHIEHKIIKDEESTKKGYGVGFLHLEEPNRDTALGLMSISAEKPLHLPDVRAAVDTKELKKYYDDVVNTDRVIIWDHFGSNDIHEVLAKIRHMHNLGAKYIFIDHLTIIVSGQEGDERKQLDEISTKLKTLCMELNIAVVAVIHQNRKGEIRNSAGPEQIANIVLALSRDKEEADPWRRSVTKVTVQKNRFCGRTGPGVYLFYDDMTGVLRELKEDEVKVFEAGGSPHAATSATEERPWI